MMDALLKRQYGTRKLLAAKQAVMRGVAAVEFALLLIPLVLLVFGVAEFGRALYQYNTLAKTVRDSARMLSQYNPVDADYPLDDAKCLAVYGTVCNDPNRPLAPLAPGLTTAMVVVCNPVTSAGCSGAYANVSTGSGTINLVEVRISGYSFSSVVPFVTGASSIMFNDIHATMRQVL